MECPLCREPKSFEWEKLPDERIYYCCPVCDLRFLRPDLRLAAEKEKARYDQHENFVEDPRYQKFVMPVVELVYQQRSIKHRGLDYGCGPGPVASFLLRKKGYSVDQYDPYYEDAPIFLGKKYDFIICIEVAEHFYNPGDEFNFFAKSLNPSGRLFLMTQMWEESICFQDWHYHRDPTHVCFYSSKSFAWIKEHFGFSSLEFHSNRLIVLHS